LVSLIVTLNKCNSYQQIAQD